MPRVKLHSARGRQSGFTLVELITVILVLGVLAAVAIPRYADLQGKARESKVRAVAGSIKAAASLARAQALSSGVNCASATGTTVSLEGRSIALNHCQPQSLTGLTAGILGAANVESDSGWTITMATGTAGDAGAELQLALSDAATPAGCRLNYTSPATAGTDSVVATTTTGC